jgi:hypothetical protein
MAEDALTHEELAVLLAEDERLAISFRDTTLADEQAVAIEYYEARPFGDEEEGLSQVVTPEVAEVVDYMTVSVARTMISGDRVVEFESAEIDNEEAAGEATAAVEYCFMKSQDGYRVIHDAIQSGLIEKIGIIKTCVEHTQRVKKTQAMVNEDQLAQLHEQGHADKIKAATPNEDGTFLIELHDQTVDTKFVDYPIPSEEFLFASRTRHEDDSDYLCHRSSKSLSDLIEMGFDRAMVEDLPNDNMTNLTDARSVARWEDETISRTPGLKKVWLREEYKRIDMDGDGIAEMVQVFRVDDTILSVEEVEENPFVVWCPFPRAHRMVGTSLADKVMDLQRIKSVVLRQQLNGLYLTNNPRMYVPQECLTDDTIDDLLTVRPGGLVRGRGQNGPTPLHEAFDMEKGMSMLQYITGERESRTGITRLNQGLDADALNKTATGTALMQAQGQQMEEYIARNFAEALARLFAKKLRLMVSVGKPFPIKVDGESKMVDPTKWPDGLSATVRVGLGSGRKDQRLQYRDMMLDAQKEALQIGLSTPKMIFNNLADMVRDAGLGIPTTYFLDPDSDEAKQMAAQRAQQPPPQDPAVMKAQAQIDQGHAKLEMQQRDSQTKAQLRMQEIQSNAQLTREQQATETQLAIEQMNREQQLSVAEFMAAQHHEHRNAEMAHEANMTKLRQGGALNR